MKAISLFAFGLAAWVLPVPGRAADPAPAPPAPVWEVQFRLDGGGDPATAAIIQSALAAAEVPVPFKGDTVVKLAKAADGAWFGEARGSFDAAGVIDTAAKKGGAWQELAGRRVLSIDNGAEGKVVLLSPQEGVVLAASDTTSVDEAIEWAEKGGEEATAWLSGHVDLQRAAGDGPRSRVLKLVHDLAFSVQTTGAETVVQVQGGFEDAASAGRAAKILEGTVALLSADPQAGKVPLDERLEITVKDRELQTRLRLANDEVAELFKSLQVELELKKDD